MRDPLRGLPSDSENEYLTVRSLLVPSTPGKFQAT